MVHREKIKIWGAPGTGKTSYLIQIVEHELSKGIKPNEIIYSSFTKAAANEARDRAIARFGGSREDYPYFNTQHSICYHLLGLEHGQVLSRRKLREFGTVHHYDFSNNHEERLDTRYQEAMLQTTADYFEFFVQFAYENMYSFEEAFHKFIRQTDVPDAFSKRALHRYIELREAYKQENKLWDFSDMILGTLQKGLIPEGIKVLILDEAQDMSRLLWALSKMWMEKVERVYLAGDPLQTLYFWSGADPELFLDFKAEEHILRTSYRLTNQTKDYAEKIISKTKYPFPEFNSSGREGVLCRNSFESIDWHSVANAFLLMRTRWLISKVAEEFRYRGIPYASERGRQCPLFSSEGGAFYTLLRLLEGENILTENLLDLIQHVRKPYIEHGAKASIKRMENYEFRLKQLPDIGFTKEFIDSLTWSGFTDILSMNFEPEDKSYLFRVYKKYGRKAFEGEPQLTLTTIHGAKGREKDSVFVFPDMTRRVWDAFLKSKDTEALVYYVACTRARNNLTLLLPSELYSYPLPRI